MKNYIIKLPICIVILLLAGCMEEEEAERKRKVQMEELIIEGLKKEVRGDKNCICPVHPRAAAKSS